MSSKFAAISSSKPFSTGGGTLFNHTAPRRCGVPHGPSTMDKQSSLDAGKKKVRLEEESITRLLHGDCLPALCWIATWFDRTCTRGLSQMPTRIFPSHLPVHIPISINHQSPHISLKSSVAAKQRRRTRRRKVFLVDYRHPRSRRSRSWKIRETRAPRISLPRWLHHRQW